MLRPEVRYFFTALMFFTRIPCPQFDDYQPSYLQQSLKYFGLVGWIVGGAGAALYLLTAQLFPPYVAVLLSMVLTVWMTGAFHEDGFADVCDGFGGGWSKEQILTIMKDSRVGAYGAIGSMLLLGLKFASLLSLSTTPLLAAALVAGHSASRFAASTFVHTHAYVQDIDRSKAKPLANTRLSAGALLFGGLLSLLPMALLGDGRYLLALLPVYGAKALLGRYFHKHIGGYTGDCLGATQQVCEVVFYLSVYALWRSF